jgi:CheY-like chemotaxis protein
MTEEECPAFVMVVDDDTDLRETLMEVLQDNEFRVVGAANGQEALDLIHSAAQRPCVILLDLMMPIMDGKAFYSALRNEPELSQIPVIVLSAHANVEAVLADVAVEAKLSKPVDIEPLLALVKRHCAA